MKGLYQRARKGEIPDFTGISSPYEEPENAELVVNTSENDVHRCVEMILQILESREVIPAK